MYYRCSDDSYSTQDRRDIHYARSTNQKGSAALPAEPDRHLLWGCRAFPGAPQPPYKEEAEGTPVTLGITVDPSSPEEVSVIWEPEHVSVMGTEVTVTYTDTGVPRTVTVVLQLGDRP